MPCWRSEQDRRRRAADEELLAAYWDTVGGVQTREDGPVTVAEVRAQACPACGQDEPGPSCWLCAYTWLAWARAEFEAEQAAQQEAVDLEFDRLAQRTQAEQRVADATGWVQRLRETVTAYRGGYGGRAVELLADLLARLAAGRTSARGRPSVAAYIGGVLAVDADWRSGRRAMPGRERTAWLAGCSDRAVYDAWRRVVALGWATRTRTGGRNSLERRQETGRWCDRAEFDLVPLHRSEVPTQARAEWVPAALGVLDELLERGQAALEQAQDALDELRARTDTWTDWPEQVRRAKLRAAVERVRATLTAPLPAADLAANICRPHSVSKGEYLSSCLYWGLRFSPPIMIHSEGCTGRPDGRGKIGASRAPTEGDRADLDGAGCGSPPLGRPRTRQRGRSRAQPRTPPAWMSWAPDLARDLERLWPWLARVPRVRVTATLGARLGPDWSAARLARWVTDGRARPVLPDPARPLAYLRALLDEAFAGDVAPPHEARAHEQRRRQVATNAATEQVAAHERLRAELAARAAGVAAARAAIRRSAQTADRPSATGPAAPVECPWPAVARPGAGLPPGLDG
jgi:hypothetical protein